jgi:SAM-dependent methyltransferase
MFSQNLEYQSFYCSYLGQKVRHTLLTHILEILPVVDKQNILGLGHAFPYVDMFLGKASRVIMAPSFAQGLIHAWPQESYSLTTRVDYKDLPFEDLFFDILIGVHFLENSQSITDHLREAWRVLKANGRFILIIPNRSGLWSRIDTTPFGHGQPYSQNQIINLLKLACFTPLSIRYALYTLPFPKSMLMKGWPLYEKIGNLVFKKYAGVMIIEVQKQVYGAIPEVKNNYLNLFNENKVINISNSKIKPTT